MDNVKTPKYYIDKILKDIEFCINNLNDVTIEKFNEDEVLSSAISFKFVQISENVKKLPNKIYDIYPNVPWMKISGLRNRIVHDYGSIQLDIIYDTVKNNLPDLKIEIEKIIKEKIMKLLFEIDKKNYDNDGKAFIRPSARAIIIKNNKIYMVHSLVYDYYKFPGGGIENNESNIDALIRETKEEAGLVVIKDSIKEYGYVHRVKKAKDPGYSIFIQDNYYYLCNVENNILEQQLDDYENFEKFTLELVDPKIAININRSKEHGPKDLDMIEREAKVLELLIKDGYFN